MSKTLNDKILSRLPVQNKCHKTKRKKIIEKIGYKILKLHLILRNFNRDIVE